MRAHSLAIVGVLAVALSSGCGAEVGRSSEALEDPGVLSSDGPCVLAAGASSCSVTLSWHAPEGPIDCLWLDSGGLFACDGPDASAVWPWTTTTPRVLILRSHPDWSQIFVTAPEVARITVYAVTAPPPPPPPPPPTTAQGTLSTTTCQLAVGASSCTVSLSWTAVNTPIACIWANGSLFACGSGSGVETWPYTSAQPLTMVLRAHTDWASLSPADPELARVVVAAQPAPVPNNPPTVSLISPVADGYAGHVGDAITVTATAADSDGSIQDVALLANGVVVAHAAAPYVFAWSPSTSGEYALAIRATDDRGASTTSAVHTAIVAELGLPSIPPTYGTAGQYFPLADSARRGSFRGISDPPGGPKLHYFSEPVATDTWYVYWPSDGWSDTLDRANVDAEEWQIRHGCAGNSDWIYVNAYHHRSTKGEGQWDVAITTTRALLDYGGHIYDITSVCPGGVGQPYVPLGVSGQPHRVRVWGGINQQQFYWEARFSYAAAITNPCWLGTGPTTRAALVFSEAWWDSNSGGTWFTGGSGGLGSDGKPSGVSVVMSRTASQGLGAGYAWDLFTLSTPVWHACSENLTPYP